MGPRRRSRELAVQVLFQLEFNTDKSERSFDLICENFESPKGVRPYALQLVQGVCEQRSELDALIRKASENWRLERMPFLDRSILRLAVYEILFISDVPPKVSIDEAVELGKKYGGEDSSGFLNGVLDRIFQTLSDQGRLGGKTP